MLVKQFRSRFVRVPDPLRPGRYANEERLVPTGATGVSHNGHQHEAIQDGWMKVSEACGHDLCSYRSPSGARFMTDTDVGEHVRVGVVDAAEDAPEELAEDAPRAPRRARPRKVTA